MSWPPCTGRIGGVQSRLTDKAASSQAWAHVAEPREGLYGQWLGLLHPEPAPRQLDSQAKDRRGREAMLVEETASQMLGQASGMRERPQQRRPVQGTQQPRPQASQDCVPPCSTWAQRGSAPGSPGHWPVCGWSARAPAGEAAVRASSCAACGTLTAMPFRFP